MTEATLTDAIRLHEAGEFSAAEALYRQAVDSAPTDARARRLLGVLICQRGALPEGIALLREAVLLAPTSAACRNSLGEALRAAGRLSDACMCFEQTIRLDPEHFYSWFNLGAALLELGPLERAEECLRQSLLLRPGWPEAHHNLGFVFAKQGRTEEAIAEYRKALAVRPENAETLNNLGTVLFDLGAGDVVAAIACYESALRLEPEHRNALLNQGNALATVGRIDAAIDRFTQLIALEPQHSNAHFNRAVLWLKQGNFAQGWPEYEWRVTQGGVRPRGFEVPRWDGSPLQGRTILLYAEQGLGDTLQFIRYAPLVREQGGRVVVECQAAVRALLETAPGIDELVVVGDRLPAFDVESPLMSLPGIFKTTLDKVPAPVPYLAAEQARSDEWRRLISTDGARLRIGIAWQGSKVNQDDQFRSMRLAEFEPLARLDGVRLYSLQKEPGAEQIDEFRDVWPMEDLRARLDVDIPFADTAALMESLDLVVTSDTSIAHLAGALGRPVWVALQSDCDHRWLLDPSDTPWYPTMRLFRQPARGKWSEVFAEIAAAAAELSR